MAIQSSLPARLKRSMSAYARQLTILVKSKAPKHLHKDIHTTVTEEGEGVIRITTTVKGKDARAQEYGSGLHAQRGTKATYPIKPKNKKLLAFFENAKGTWIYPPAGSAPTFFAPDGRGLFGKVDHPGIHAVNSEKGFLRPAYQEFRKKLRSREGLPDVIKKAFLSDIRRSFRGNK